LTYVNDTTTGDRSLNTNGTITIETDGTALASIVNNASPISGKNDNNRIINNSSQLGVILNNLYISNKAGRGIYNDYRGTLTITNSTISGNTATRSGGGIYNDYNGTLTLNNNTISGNTATYGGGIYNSGTLILTNNTIANNTANHDGKNVTGSGGGIYNSGTLILTNNTIANNTANHSGALSGGGGIYNHGTLTLTNNTITGNTANYNPVPSISSYGWGGGIFNNYGGTLTLISNTISGNRATNRGDGGGIGNVGGTLTLTNNTITGNTATGSGGGIISTSWYGSSGTLTLTNNIITNNSAYYGSGLVVGSGSHGGKWSSNSIISGNTANQVWYIDLENPDGPSTTGKYSWINGKSIANPIDPKYPNIFDTGTFTALPPTPDSPPKPTISVSNAWFDAPAGKVIFEVKLSSTYDKPITVDYYTLDGSANSIDPNQLKDFNNVVKQTLSFFPGQTSKQIEITVLGSAPPTDQTFEIFARDTAYRDWTDTDKGKEVDKIYDYSDLGYEGYRINKVFKDSTTGFDAFGLTSDEKFFLVLANPLNANEFTSNSNNLLQDIANTSGGNNTAAYTAGQNLINQLTSANQSYTFTDGTIYDLAKPPVLAIRGTESVNDLLSGAETEGIGYNQFTNNKAAVNQWLSEVTNPVSGLTLKPNITGHSLGGALSQWVGGSYTGQLGKIVTFNSPGISQQPGINFNATNNLGVTHYITSADLVSIAGSTYLNGLWNLDKYSKLTSAITFEKHSVPVLNQTITRTNLSKPTDLTRKVTNGNTTDLSSYWFTYLPDADYWVLQVAVAAISPILGAALTFRGTVELNRKAIGSAIDGLGTRSDAVTSAYNAAKSWTSDAWDAIIGQSDKKLGLSPSTANQINSPLKLESSFLDTNSYQIATTATASQTIDNFWDAIPNWGDDAWQATTKWSADAWESIDEWTPQTWQATTTWTAADWDKPFLTISNPTIKENNSGTNNLIFKVTLSTTSTQTITVNYATADNTATAGSDYIAKTGTLTFTPGQISQDIIISVNGDTAIEPDETFLINLSNPSNALITDNEGLGTITNDDGDDISVTLPIITLTISPESVTEDGTTNLVYTFTRTGVTTDALTVNYTVEGTATFDTDYSQTGAASFTSTTGTVSFAANSATATVTIDPTTDTTVEPDETVALTLASGTGYTVGTTDAVVGIITDTNNETPSNQAPTDLALSATTVNENVAPNTVIGTFSSTDPDTGNSFIYSLVAGTGDTDNTAFSIMGNQLQINNSPDFETKNSYSIRVKTTDQGGLGFEKVLTITVNDVNETPGNLAPTDLALSATTVNENVPVNTVIGTFSSTDPDTGNSFTYSLVAGTGDTDNTAFSIVGNQLQINNSPDFETKNSYSIRVKTTDQGGLGFEKVLVITVNDVNETPSNQAPTNLALSATTVNENVAPNTVIGTFSSTDPDTGNSFIYSLVAGTGDTDNSAFSIVGNQLQINNSPDFETKNSYSIRVKTTDQGGLGFEKVLVITVNDLNENPSNQAPTDLALSATTVNENVAPNTVIGTFSSTDPDTGNSFIYSLVAGTGDTDNTAFSIVGNQLQINNSPDFETKNSYSIRVKTTDQGGLEFEKTLTITVNDVNETPSNQAPTALIFQNAVTELAENVDVTPEFKVADLLIEDDGLGTNNLFLTGRDRERFLIQNSALFYVGFAPNFEAQNSYEVTVNVDDPTVGVSPDLTQTFTLNITDVNEAPTALILANSTNAIAENTDTSQGVKVADIQISDDALGTNSLSLLGNDQSSFQIRGRELFFIGKADFEAQSLYNLTVAVTDTTLNPAPSAAPDATVNFTLGITNLPDQALNPQTIQFNNTGNGQGSLVFNFSDLPGSIQVKAIEEGLQQTGAFFNNVVGLYPVADDNGAVFDSLDLDGDGNVTELIQPGQAGYARTALSQAVNNFILRASGEGANQSTTAAEFGDVLLEGGRRYAPFVIANGGNLGGSLQGSIQAFLSKNPDNVAATLENYMSHEVAYFSFGAANPDGAEHLRSRGNNIFGFEDLPGNLPNISDNDFNDGILAFNFIA
jgi:hypothetical protein